MRRYLQGTLDFACGAYAIINTLSLTHGLDLANARTIFRETHIALAARPGLWADYMGNATDHYWLVRYMLQRWCAAPPYKLRLRQPFSACLLPGGDAEAELASAPRFLPERERPTGPASPAAAAREAESTWRELASWLGPGGAARRTAIFRFHRFVPRMEEPVVSHWTTAAFLDAGALFLHDASAEQNALHRLEQKALVPGDGARALVRIVPESVLLAESAR